MSYQVLARKWRPRRFQEMVGQAPILRMLTNALEQQYLHHAYLFTGTRGVGKTTLARILAKCFNCERGPTAAPCEQCHACLAANAGKFLDLYEVDAASRTKVEDTRELLDNILYPPIQGRYKIYLIDEVHMLSSHSFNALLKTLEEPPEHVKFLLATTDPKRLPITILSRCLQFHLKRLTPEQITQQIQHICITESITAEPDALAKLAKAADGSMRDALTLLDQAIAFGKGIISSNDVQTMLGSVAKDDLLPLLTALAEQSGKKLFAAMALLTERSPDFHAVLEELISVFHQLAMIQIIPDVPIADDTLLPLANCFTPEDIQLYYQIALLGRRDLALSSLPQQGFEMTMLRMLAFKPSMHHTNNIQDIETPAIPCQINQPVTPPVPTPTQQAEASDTMTHNSLLNWRDILPKLELAGMAQALATNCTLEAMVDTKITLSLSTKHAPMLHDKLKQRIQEALSHYFNQPIQLHINLTSEELITPIKETQQKQQQLLISAKETIMQIPQVQKLVEQYDATVEVSLLE
jgi:DNA polymerase-3 subunit gamma/tau